METYEGLNELNKGFMKPQIVYFTAKEAKEENIENPRRGYYSRLSANGYLDCTDWFGPFNNPTSAMEALVDAFCD